ncbi:MAG: TrkH family potassium uptake protein [Eubacteriales bacterium]
MQNIWSFIKSHLILKRDSIKPTQILVMGFASVIFIGAILLSLPISTKSGISSGFLTALFTATSAVCVTGLVVQDTATYWSPYGQTIIVSLIQIGGLGFMTFTTLIFIISRKKITFKERLLIHESLNTKSMEGIVRFARYVMFFTLAVESMGALLLSIQFIPEFGVKRGIVMSIFHSISAFCNAGFDLIGGFKSFTPYVNNVIINGTVSFLVIIGGLGFFVVGDVFKNRKKIRKLTMHSKLVLSISFFLILFGAIFIMLLEWDNPATMGHLPWYGKIFSSFFHSITPRTAGFNTLDMAQMSTAAIFLTIVFMFIGGSPGSTAGGVKTTTIGALVLTVTSLLNGQNQTQAFGRSISINIIKRALAVIAIGLFIIIFVIMMLSITEKASFLEIVFEVFSAFGTVGLSMGLTPNLTFVGRIIIILTMFIGRLGPLTIALAISEIQSSHESGNYKYPDGNIIVG